jgi:hypothetical protein
MAQTTVIVGNREYTVQSLSVMDAAKFQMRITQVLAPLGALVMSGGNMDIKDAAPIIASVMDDGFLSNIVLPVFEKSRVYDNEGKFFLNSETAINKAFTAEALDEFYELIWEVGKFQFGPFIDKMKSRSGVLQKLAASAKAKTTEA